RARPKSFVFCATALPFALFSLLKRLVLYLPLIAKVPQGTHPAGSWASCLTLSPLPSLASLFLRCYPVFSSHFHLRSFTMASDNPSRTTAANPSAIARPSGSPV